MCRCDCLVWRYLTELAVTIGIVYKYVPTRGLGKLSVDRWSLCIDVQDGSVSVVASVDRWSLCIDVQDGSVVASVDRWSLCIDVQDGSVVASVDR